MSSYELRVTSARLYTGTDDSTMQDHKLCLSAIATALRAARPRPPRRRGRGHPAARVRARRSTVVPLPAIVPAIIPAVVPAFVPPPASLHGRHRPTV
eukprot:4477710-Prymnesium_polylepis.1